jgi:pimeloyl-ACP methyl ester carboxylesterase
VRALSYVGSFDRAFLAPLLEPGVDIDHGYTVFTLRYVTRDLAAGLADPEAPVEVLATLTLPRGTTPPAAGFPIVVNAHGTTGLGDDCAVTGRVAGTGLAGLFGSRGAIGIAPDYPGLGLPGPHPYLVAASAGPAMLDAVRAALGIAEHRGVPTSGGAAIVGFSQGGHAALSAARYWADHAAELDLRAIAVSGPASVWVEHWRPGLGFDGPHLRFHALLAYAWATRRGVDLERVFQAELAADLPGRIEGGCLGPLPPGVASLEELLPASAEALFRAPFRDAFGRVGFPGFPELGDAFRDNRVAEVPAGLPVAVYQGALDSVVPAAFTRELVAGLRADGVSVHYVEVAGGRHDDVAFGPLADAQLRTEASVAWVRERLR